MFFTLTNSKKKIPKKSKIQNDLYQITAAPDRYTYLPQSCEASARSSSAFLFAICRLNLRISKRFFPTARSGDVSNNLGAVFADDGIPLRFNISSSISKYITFQAVGIPWESQILRHTSRLFCFYLLRLSKSKTRLANVQCARRCRETSSTPVQAPKVSPGNWQQIKGYKGQHWNSFSFLRTWDMWKIMKMNMKSSATHPCFP